MRIGTPFEDLGVFGYVFRRRRAIAAIRIKPVPTMRIVDGSGTGAADKP